MKRRNFLKSIFGLILVSVAPVLLIFFTSPAFAASTESSRGFDANIFTHSFLTDDDTFSRGNSSGLELSYSPNGKGFFFVSKENISVQIIYKSFKYDVTGFGFGHRIQLTRGIRITGQVGYYIIENSIGRRKDGFSEGFSYYLNSKFRDATGRDLYRVDAIGVLNDNAIGASVGIEFDYPMTKKFNFTSGISYRLMKFDQTIIGYNYKLDAIPRNWWESTGNQDFSSLIIRVGVNYKF